MYVFMLIYNISVATSFDNGKNCINFVCPAERVYNFRLNVAYCWGSGRG